MTDTEAIKILSTELWHTESHKKIEGKAPEYYEELSQIAEALQMAINTLKNEKTEDWFEHIPKGCLKARKGEYVLYKVDYLLDHLTREVYIMEGARKMGGTDNG